MITGMQQGNLIHGQLGAYLWAILQRRKDIDVGNLLKENSLSAWM
jgi:hypothetical protein